MKYSSFGKLFLTVLASVAFGFVACAGNESDDEPTVTLSATSLDFSSYDGFETQQFVVTYKKVVRAEADDNWCVVLADENNGGGKYSFSVTPLTNYEENSRSTTIRIKQYSTELATITVTQAPHPHADKSFASLFGTVGWNYGNQMDAHSGGVSSETAWLNMKATQQTFMNLKAAGFSTVRIPVTWMGHIGNKESGYAIETAWMDRVAELVGYCENAGMNAIVNIHHDGADAQYWLNIKEAAMSETAEADITEKLVAVWKQIATRFSDKGDWLMFETMNEVQDGGWGYGDNTKDGGKQYAVLNRWNQACVDAIRSVGGENATRWIGVPGYSTNIDLTLKNLVVPTDAANRVAVAVHCYDPYNFTLECKQDSYSASDISGLNSQFSKLKSTYLDKGVQCYVGEFGCCQRTTDEAENTRCLYLKEYAQVAKKYGLSIIVWDNNADNGGKGGKECNAYIRHDNGEYISAKGKAAVEAIMEGYN